MTEPPTKLIIEKFQGSLWAFTAIVAAQGTQGPHRTSPQQAIPYFMMSQVVYARQGRPYLEMLAYAGKPAYHITTLICKLVK